LAKLRWFAIFVQKVSKRQAGLPIYQIFKERGAFSPAKSNICATDSGVR
jgi:hypothetical protein